MNNKELNLGLREYGINCFRKAFKDIHTNNQDVIYPEVLKLSQYVQPELNPLRFLISTCQAALYGLQY
ncbi:MAG: hypothetical protein ACJA0T_001296 [Colwellia sp.]|jgi:hypothetical protein